MEENVDFSEGFEVLGQSVLSIIAAMGDHAWIAWRLFARHGVRRILPDHWYPMQMYLDVYRDIGAETGDHTLLSIGKRIPEQSAWPPGIQDIESGLRSIDVAYHMNTRRDGVVMFDPATGTMLEGIGHYTIESVRKRRIVMASDTPYPSEFDRGILLGVARKFKPHAEVVRDTSKPTRKEGGRSCTYIVTW